MDPLDIVIELKRAGISQADIDRRSKPPVPRQMVCQAIAGKLKSERVEEAVATALGKKVEQVFSPDSKN